MRDQPLAISDSAANGVFTIEQQFQNNDVWPRDYRIERSLRFRASAGAQLSRTPAVAGNRKTWTWSAWVKRGALTSAQGLMSAGTSSNDWSGFRFNSDDTFAFYRVGPGGGTTTYLNTTSVFRDVSAWYHLVLQWDTTRPTAADRIKLFLNGAQITAFAASSYPAQNYDEAFLNTAIAHLACNITSTSQSLDGYLAEVNFIDGQALTPSSFGYTDSNLGVWRPKRYAGTYGANGFYLPFNNVTSLSTLTADASGNANNWTATNISLTSGATYDSMLDVPTPYADGGNGRGNYATLNPVLVGRSDGGGAVWSARDGNLFGANANGSGGWAIMGSTMAIPSGGGKFYFECTIGSAGQSSSVGVQRVNTPFAAQFIIGYAGDANGYSYDNSGLKWNNGSSSYGTAAAAGDVIGVAIDASLSTASITFYKNNVSMGVAFSGVAGDLLPALSSTSGSGNCAINFGQRPFAYTPPSGFLALHTGNLHASGIIRGNQHFDAVTRVGTGASASVSSLQFQPGLVWIKQRSGSAQNHFLMDSVRGKSGTNYFRLQTDNTAAEDASVDHLTSISQTGYTVGASVGTNAASQSYVDWLWKAGTAVVANTSGSITSQVSANAAAGFSIVTYTGTGANATVGHGLGVAPKLIIQRPRGGPAQWPVYNASIGAANALLLNSTAALGSYPAMWNSTTPTSSVFSLGTDPTTNTVGACVAYCFAEVSGYSRFGSYTGNGSADGPFIYLGFRPRWVMIKRTDATSDWLVFDAARSTFNSVDGNLGANSSAAESNWATTNDVDFTSNGFKLRHDGSTGYDNFSTATYIYAAFAETPFKYSLAR